MSIRGIIFLSVLILGGMGSGVLMFWGEQIIESPLKLIPRNQRNFEAYNFQATRFTAAGVLQHAMQGSVMKGNSQNQTLAVIAPTIQFNTADHKKITITADHAMWDQTLQQLLFTSNVKVLQTSDNTLPPTEINAIIKTPDSPIQLTTSVLQWNQRDNKLSTPTSLNLQANNAILTAGLMEADQALSVVQLAKGIKIIWQPASATSSSPANSP